MRDMMLAMALVLGTVAPAAAQSDEAVVAAVTRYMKESGSGVIDQSNYGRRLLLAKLGTPAVARAPDKVIAYARGRAVARLPADQGSGDVYVLLRRRLGAWRVDSVAGSGITDPMAAMHDYLLKAAKPGEAPDPFAKAIEMSFLDDKAYRAWFDTHRVALNAAVAIGRAWKGWPDLGWGYMETPEIRALLEPLTVNELIRAPAGYYEVHFTGFGGERAGFIHVPAGVAPPRIDPEGVFWIEPIGDGWYYFRSL